MLLSDFVGQNVTLLIPFFHQTKLQEVKLHGVEAGGIWIESQAFTNQALQRFGVATAPKTLVFFLPYSQISLGIASGDWPALDEKAFGV
jgi:hypothetical protein